MNEYKQSSDPPVDLVYLYVNSKDPEWAKERSKYQDDFNNGPWRYRDNQELRWSLRSVEKHAPWIRNIFIVSNSSMPDWLNTEHDKIRIVRHEEILPPELLPCFNCNTLEARLCEIPGLSELFIYANDDMFFGNDVSKDFFIRDGKPVLRMQKMGFDPESPKEYYHRIVSNAFRLFRQHFGTEYRVFPWHTADVYSRSAMKDCNRVFAEELRTAAAARLRSDNDIQRVLYQYDLLKKDACYLKVYDRSNIFRKALHTLGILFLPADKVDFAVCGMHLLFQIPFLKDTLPLKPRCVCVNDDEWTTEEDLDRYRRLMERVFPDKSSFER